jgi:hypothetical protein
MDFASKDIYNFKEKITRFDHSVTTSMIVYNLTYNKKMTLSALFHDVSTPCFSHVIDYMNGDYETQESTEKFTREIVLKDKKFLSYLKEDGFVNYFKMDNYIDEEMTKVHFISPKHLNGAYLSDGHFNVTHNHFAYKMGDFERLRIEDKTASIRDKRKRIVEQLETIGRCETEADMQYVRDLRAADSFIVDAYELLVEH